MNIPRYTHNCDRCEFLGQYGNYDLYVCPKFNDIIIDTLVVRFGNESPDYASGAVFGIQHLNEKNNPYREALKRAVKKGFIASQEMKDCLWRQISEDLEQEKE